MFDESASLPMVLKVIQILRHCHGDFKWNISYENNYREQLRDPAMQAYYWPPDPWRSHWQATDKVVNAIPNPHAATGGRRNDPDGSIIDLPPTLCSANRQPMTGVDGHNWGAVHFDPTALALGLALYQKIVSA